MPSHIQTVYVPPVENETTRLPLTEQLTQRLLEAVSSRFGVQVGVGEDADAVVDATITGYRDDAVSIQGREGVGAQVFQRRVVISASVEIVDQVRDRALWSSSAVSGTGEYDPDEESENVGIELALENLVQKIVDGAQSQW